MRHYQRQFVAHLDGMLAAGDGIADFAAAVPELLAATMRYAALVDHGGIASIRAERRAQHLARLLGHAIPYPCAASAAEALLAELPPYLSILTLAYHGNPALIPQLLPFLYDCTCEGQQAQHIQQNHAAPHPPTHEGQQAQHIQPDHEAPHPQPTHEAQQTSQAPQAQQTQQSPSGAGGLYKRRALWALSFILGINPEHEGLLSDNPSLSADWPIAPGLDQDTGLPEGDADKVTAWWLARQEHYLAPAVPSPSSPLLSGRRMDEPAVAKELMSSGMQAQRFAAALHACRLSPKAPWLDTRAPWAMQKRWIEEPWA